MANKFYSSNNELPVEKAQPSPRPFTDPGSVPGGRPSPDRTKLPGRPSAAFRGYKSGLPKEKRIKQHVHEEGLA